MSSVPPVIIKGRRPRPAPDLTRLTPAGEKLLNAASDLFYARGIHAVGVDTIAEMAGTTKKTLYDRFGSKDVLVSLYLQRRAERWRRFVEEHLIAVRTTGGADGDDRSKNDDAAPADRTAAKIGRSPVGPSAGDAPAADGAAAVGIAGVSAGDDGHGAVYEAAVQRVCAVLDALEEWNSTLSRGCAFINAFAEIGGGDHPGVAVIRAEKDWTRALYAELLRESGLEGTVTDRLSAQLAMVQEGALMMWTAGGMPDAMDYARDAARRLLRTALGDGDGEALSGRSVSQSTAAASGTPGDADGRAARD
ncbi:helix-turn-helix transcriptional regulator [Phytoactinopolyspora halotolerans]|uniref:Helix-turn-helix transcriptional regulator n=2 Tax=Phytoactinopolyspora halotolerans TaxID=1981512 RepID=A0A6L9SDD0_9ACTN|nr:helix-turn-helix transcriptional regulator [Phytoactinopolyspora halotolerans]